MNKLPKNIPEDELILLLQGKDKRGFVMLYDNYSPALYGIILKIVRIEEIAEDVMQDAFVKIWKNMDSYNASKGSLFTWILNVARNTAIDKIRSQGYKQEVKIQPIDNNIGFINKTANTHQQIEHIGIQKVVTKLKPEHQIIIDLLYFKGYTQTEAAKELNIPLGTLKTRVKLAINHLRTLIT